MLKKSYDSKCDIWSIGVILFILLSGSPPFNGQKDEEILAQVEKGKYDFNSPEWSEISEDAKDFIRKMMQLDVKHRFNADQCLNHNWIKNN